MRKRKTKRWFRLWAKALGEKASQHDHEADVVAIIRTFIFASYLITNVAIIANAWRHWPKEKPAEAGCVTVNAPDQI